MEKIFCPKCRWEPRPEDLWMCSPGCGHVWNTFDSRGVCPSCIKVWEVTQCLACGQVSAHEDWYHSDEEVRVADRDVVNGSPSYEPCLTEQLWEELSTEIENYLTTISLADMMRNDEVQELSRAHDLRQKERNPG